MTDTDSSLTTDLETDEVLIGKIAGVYGIKGWVKVLSYTRPRNNIMQYAPWVLGHGQNRQEWQVIDCKPQGKGIIAQLEGISDRDAAMSIQQHDIYIDRANLAPLAAGEYYWHDVIGLRVINLQDEALGTVTDIIETGANDVLVVEGESRELIPWVQEIYVISIDINDGNMVVDWQAEAAKP